MIGKSKTIKISNLYYFILMKWAMVDAIAYFLCVVSFLHLPAISVTLYNNRTLRDN
jgi:hypothetical protein